MDNSKPLPPKLQFWLDHIKAADNANQSLAAYAKERELPIKNLYNARSSLRKSGHLEAKTVRAFVKAKTTAKTAPLDNLTSVSILFENGVQCQVASTLDQLNEVLNRIKML